MDVYSLMSKCFIDLCPVIDNEDFNEKMFVGLREQLLKFIVGLKRNLWFP